MTTDSVMYTVLLPISCLCRIYLQKVEGSLLKASEQIRSFSAEAKQQPRKKTVMFVCKRNSCRSQVRAGYFYSSKPGEIEIYPLTNMITIRTQTHT